VGRRLVGVLLPSSQLTRTSHEFVERKPAAALIDLERTADDNARVLGRFYRRRLAPLVHSRFYRDLIVATDNFRGLTWLGQPIWQNPLDVWNLQEAIAEVRPELFIECGTNQGGSSLFVAHLMDVMGAGAVISVDVRKLHDRSHARITDLLGSSTDTGIAAEVRARAAACAGPIFVMLDSDHSARHVAEELELYGPLVTMGSYCFVQDGVIDTDPLFADSRPGPLPAIEAYLSRHPGEWAVDERRASRFLVTHHPKGWLRRVRPSATGR
jgi:cephalosporin hydroxylase